MIKLEHRPADGCHDRYAVIIADNTEVSIEKQRPDSFISKKFPWFVGRNGSGMCFRTLRLAILDVVRDNSEVITNRAIADCKEKEER